MLNTGKLTHLFLSLHNNSVSSEEAYLLRSLLDSPIATLETDIQFP